MGQAVKGFKDAVQDETKTHTHTHTQTLENKTTISHTGDPIVVEKPVIVEKTVVVNADNDKNGV